MSLNKEQAAAVDCGGGPVLVIAGPGSGKTTVITHRIQWLIDHEGVNPANILTVTFTRAAAKEMRQRFFSMEGKRLPVSFGTFHSVFFSVLKSVYRLTGENIAREEQKFEIIKDIAARALPDEDDISQLCPGLLSEISLVKDRMTNIEHFYSSQCSADTFREIFRRYNKTLRDKRLLDFDDMMIYTWRLFRKRPDVLAAWQNKFRYILVDEFQDIGPVQYQLIRMLAAPQDNLFTVGDDDQSIYGFRGANPYIMLNFDRDYPAARRITLSVNYRSQANIVRAAGRLISANTQRFQKNIRASREKSQRVNIKEFGGIFSETDAVLADIRKYSDLDGRYDDIAILLRTNTQARPYIEKLMEYNIPFSLQGNVPDLYQHWISRDILAYTRIAAGGRDRRDYLRIINRPNRYVGRDAFPDRHVDPDRLYIGFSGKPWIQRRIKIFFIDMNAISHMTPARAVEYIRTDMDYDRYIKGYCEERQLDVGGFMEILDELQESASQFEDIRSWHEHIDEVSSQLRGAGAAGRNRDPAGDSGVAVATMHHSKGLEYKHVIIPDVNEGVSPYRKAVSDEAVEEERRMFYVAMTRAKDTLDIYYLKERNGRDMKRSRFLDDIMGA